MTFFITALFNNMRTLEFKAQPTNAFFASVNQMFGGPSQLPTMLSELCSTIWFDYPSLGSIVGSKEEPPNIWFTVAKNVFVGWALNCRVRMFLKSAVNAPACMSLVSACNVNNVHCNLVLPVEKALTFVWFLNDKGWSLVGYMYLWLIKLARLLFWD